MRAIRHLAGERARYDILARIVTIGRAAEKRNRQLVAQIDAPEPANNSDLDELVADPHSIYEGAYYVASASRTILNAVAGGARLDESVVANAVAIAGKANLSPLLGFAAYLLALSAAIIEFERTVAEQRELARAEIAERVDLSWDVIKKIIDERGREADVFLQKTWVPMLKTVADRVGDRELQRDQRLLRSLRRTCPTSRRSLSPRCVANRGHRKPA